MARSYPIQNSFNAGELSPRLVGRTDIEKYTAGAQTIKNLIVQAQGGLFHRSGTRFVQEVKDSSNKTRLVPFIVSTVQAYILEFSNNLIRFYKDEGVITSGGNPVELVTTYTTAEIPELMFSQTVDSLYICHVDHAFAKLTRTSDINWTLADVDFQDGPYIAKNLTTTTLTPSAVGPGAGITITASSTDGINDGVGFESTDEGRLIRLLHSGPPDAVGWAVITSRNSDVEVTVDVQRAFGGVGGTDEWWLGAFGDATYTGHPRAIAFHEQRMWLAANPGAAQTIYGSVISEFETFSPTDIDGSVLDDSGMSYTIAAEQANTINWMDSGRTLILGTSRGIWPVQATTTLEPITPTNIQIKRSDVAGAAEVAPVHVDDVSIYVSRTKRQLLSAGYVGEKDSFIAEDLTLLADHITESGIDEVAYAREPNSVVWCVRNDGVLVGLTNVTAQKVFAWHRHIIGGSFGTGDAVVESVAVVPAPDGDPSSVDRDNIPHDQVWLIVKRTINDETKRYVEFFEDDFADTDVLEDAFFVDSGLTYEGVAADTITGLDHLNGETVQILVNGAAHPDRTVFNGSITLAAEYTKVHVGRYPATELLPMNLEVQTRGGSSQGRLKRVPILVLRFDRTLGCEVATNPDLDEFTPVFFRSAGDPMDAPPPLFTGDKRVALETGWSREVLYKLQQAKPLPWNLAAAIPYVEVSGR